MPITRKPGEDRDEFLSRCISTEVESGMERDQASAICYLQLKKVNMQEEGPAISQEELNYCMDMLKGQNPTYVGPAAMKICIARLTAKKINQEQYDI